MLSHYKILSVTHKTVNLKQIKHFVADSIEEGTDLKSRLTEIRSHFQFGELFYLQTCNRVLYFFTSEQKLGAQFKQDFFSYINPGITGEIEHSITDHVLQFEGENALQHLMEVASSIDSLVIGEREILRQLRESYDKCLTFGLIGNDLKLALDQAVLVAKSVFSQTGIGEKPVSVVSLAVRKMLHTNIRKDARVLMVGAGQTNSLVAKFLAKYEFSNLTVFNRSQDKADQLAQLLGGSGQALKDLPLYRNGFDCLIVCTGATTPIITKQLYDTLLAGETDTKTVIDLAIPHNVDKNVVEDFPIRYIEIDGLKSMASENLAFREQEVVKAKILIVDALASFPSLYRQRQLELAFRQIPTEVKAVKEKAFNEVFHKEVATLDQQSRDLLERMMSYMEKKCIGIPMRAAREAVI